MVFVGDMPATWHVSPVIIGFSRTLHVVRFVGRGVELAQS